MYRREKQSKVKDLHNMPSFSSTLLDEIYRSIDGNVEKTEHSIVYKEKPSTTTCLRKASLVEGSGQLSSLDNADIFGSQKNSKVSGLPTRPKPVRTGTQGLFDDYQKKSNDSDDLTKSKSKALKIYSHFKKMKQPISPGMKLTNFINTLFGTSSGKKSKNVENCKGFQETKSSSACSFSRSCLNKHSPKSREKIKDGIQRTVRFHPLNVNVVDDDSGRSKKGINNDDTDVYGKPPLPPNTLAELKQNMKEKNRRIEEALQKVLEGYNHQIKNEEVTRKALQGYNRQNKDTSSMFRRKCNENYEDDDDAMSDSSSDLFELDHLASFRNNNFSEELPVYETTQYESSRAKVRGLIR